MIRYGCEEENCAYCHQRQRNRPTVYTARALAQHNIMLNKAVCPRIAELFVPLNNFARPPAPENLIQRMTCGKLPPVETTVVKPNIGIMVRPPHVSKHKPKAKEALKEKTFTDVGQYQLRRLSAQWMEKVLPSRASLTQVIEITNDTKDDSFLRQILSSLSDVRILSQSFLDPPKYRTHRNLITNQASVHLMFDELDRKHLPLLFDALYRALHDPEMSELTFNQQIHCLHLAWQALVSIENPLEFGGRPLATTLVDFETREPNFKGRLDAFAVFLSKYEMFCAEPVIRVLQSLLVYQWDATVYVTGLRSKCLMLLKALHGRFSTNTYLAPLFHNKTIATTALTERHQRSFAEAFSSSQETFLDHPYLFTPSQKIALYECWSLITMEAHHKQGWSLRRLTRHFWNLGFNVDLRQSAYFGLIADRQDILHDITKAIVRRGRSVLWKPIKVKYAGEQGIDLAGLTADLLARSIKAAVLKCLEDYYLKECQGVWFAEGYGTWRQAQAEFKRLGALIGLAMYNGVKSLPLDFPPMFYKKLVGEPLVPEDIKDFDPVLYRGWQNLLGSDVEGLTFEYSYYIEDSVLRTHVMEYDGSEPRAVTPENRERYIQSLFTAMTDTLISANFNALLSGLESVIPRRVLRFFTASELQNLIAGARVIDVRATVDLLKQVTVYDGFSPSDPIIQDLWTILADCTPEQFSRFLDLITASDRIPASFPANFKLTIFKTGTDEEMYYLILSS